MKNSASPRLPPLPHDSPFSPLKAEGLLAVSASHTYHLCGSISSAALREKSDVSAGKGFMPFHKTMFDLFLSKRLGHFSIGYDIFYRLGHFLWKGMKPFPVLGMPHPISPQDPCKCLIIKESVYAQ